MSFDVPAAAARMRIPLSRLLGVAAVAVFVLVPSPFEYRSAPDMVCAALGFALIAVGALGRLWSLSFISGHKNVNLVTDGPYSMTRNPLYFFSAVGAIGIGVASRNPLVLALIAGFFLIYYPAVVLHEERVLSGMHGDAFADYKRRVPRFIPRLALFREPEEWTVRMPSYRRTFGDALGFMMAWMVVEVLAWARHADLPVPWPDLSRLVG